MKPGGHGPAAQGGRQIISVSPELNGSSVQTESMPQTQVAPLHASVQKPPVG
jgi:hypothetical protein